MIGGASVINILIGMIRMKVAAVLLGPTGVGVIGLMTSISSTASVIAGLGFGNVGTRQIATAVASDDETNVVATRRALFLGTSALAILGAAIFWLLRDVFAYHILKDESLASEVGWLAIVVGVTVASTSQTAVLTGMRRVGDIARVGLVSSFFAAILGIGALVFWGRSGLVFFILAAPLASFIVGHYYVAQLPRLTVTRTPMHQVLQQWGIFARLGAAFMVGGLLTVLGQLGVRTLVQANLGSEALGFFQAASVISTTYIGLVLGAMGTDYYPRLTAVIEDGIAVNKLINEQLEVALLLAGPFLVALMSLAPWIVSVLYSGDFYPATEVLRWHVLGDLFKLCGWSLGYVILAAGNGRGFMLTESIAIGIYILLNFLLLPIIGLTGSGVAFFGMYVVYFPIVYWMAWRRTGFHCNTAVWKLLAILMLALIAIFSLVQKNPNFGMLSGLAFCVVFGIYSAWRLISVGGGGKATLKIAIRMRELLIKLRISSDE